MDRRRAAVEFLTLVAFGRIDEAYERFVDPAGRHHNAYSPAGFPALRRAMIENHGRFPNKHLAVQHALADGDVVAVHSRLELESGGAVMSVVHLLRFDGDRIVEMWDVGQSVPADSPNADGAF